MENWKNGVGSKIEAKLIEQVIRIENMPAQHFGECQISVQSTRENAIIYLNVDLHGHTCTCLAWQMSGIPCAHACAAIKLVNGNVYTYVDDCYKFSAQEKIYGSSMRPIATHDRPRPNALTVTDLLTQTLLEPPLTRRPGGRSKKRRKESQFQNRRLYHCGRCKQAGHTAKTCKNPNPT